ncbi:START domain-containing protein [Desulfosudis oleivorans]|uniref:Lipid-binding START domain protein n=1 Tax=Desulfosudis oleivorans (strain DSM 6200 / JCM 39069 / Hxd3) TaxID=96561 RepID=A8ZVI0_DESOH|nr:START domain-containing protein [Desulfosudis oleivorans]ABW68167.1 lipid-binding START domain protein [Desulfosudis oleivorans Hxd3]
MEFTEKKIVFKILVSICLVVCLPFDALAQEWERVLEQDGIVVYERQRPDAPMRDFRAEMVLDSSPASVLALFDDTEQTPQWFAHCRRLERIAEITPDEHFLYNITEFPWPLKDRDAVLHSIRTFEKENKRFVIDYQSDEKYAYPSAEPGLVRVNHVEGQWTITPLGPHRTLVTSRVYADMGTLLPGWTLNPFFREATHLTFVNLRQTAQSPEYRDAIPSRELLERLGISAESLSAKGPVADSSRHSR